MVNKNVLPDFLADFCFLCKYKLALRILNVKGKKRLLDRPRLPNYLYLNHMSSFHYCELFALCMYFRYWQCLESSLWLEVRSAVLSYQFDSRSDPIFFCKEKGFNRVRSLSMHSPYCLFVSRWCLSNKKHHIPKWRYEISFLVSKK